MDDENAITIFWYIWLCLVLIWLFYVLYYNFMTQRNMF